MCFLLDSISANTVRPVSVHTADDIITYTMSEEDVCESFRRVNIKLLDMMESPAVSLGHVHLI